MLLRRFILMLSALLLACAGAPGHAATRGAQDVAIAMVSQADAADAAASIAAALATDADTDASDDGLVDNATTRALPAMKPVQPPALSAHASIQPCPERLERPPR
ncbi:MAG: hypothetical protein JO369_00715 [Paucibacter sp.]|nr:hypothetical protein [Roseateles sp.]